MAPPRRTLRRYEGQRHARYLTCSCFRRLPLFKSEAIKDAFAEQLARAQSQMQFELFAWAIMPEHFHLLLRPKHDLNAASANAACQTVTQILRKLKGPFARRVVERWRVLDAPILRRINDKAGRVRFWQPGGGYDRNITSDAEFFEKINYIHANPVRRGLVDSARDYRWSSAKHFDGAATYTGPAISRLT